MSRRIAVMGSSCSGKTTPAAELAVLHGVAHVELDALHHGPDRREVEAWLSAQRPAAAGAG